MYIIASIIMLISVFFLTATTWSNITIIHRGHGQLQPWVDGMLIAYLVAYFLFIYR